MKKTIPLDSRKAGALVLVLVLGLAMETANADFTFGTPTNLGPPVNSVYGESTSSISVDGLELYFIDYPNPRPGGYGNYDIWITTRATKDDPWGEPVNLGPPVNSSADDFASDISADGLSLYFASDRPGGYGNRDIWVTTRPTVSDPWGTPVNLGPTVNSSGADRGPSISADGLSLFFFSERSGGQGSQDILVTTRENTDDDWGAPVNLGPIVNSSERDYNPDISADGLWLFVQSARSGGYGGSDLWVTTRDTIDDEWGTPVNLGPTVNSSDSDNTPNISADGSTLFFSSDRPGGFGGYDIWQVSIEPVVDLNGDGIVDIDDLLIMIEHWGTDEPLCDIGPMPWGDGIVDVQDLIVLAEHLFEDYRLAAHWEFDETEGSIAYDSIDVNDGICYGEPIWQPAEGKVGGALEFDGIDDYVSTPFILDPTKGSLSVFAWIKGGAPGQVIISQTGGFGGTWLGTNSSEGKLMTGFSDMYFGALESESVITDGQWHHVGLVYDFDSLHRHLYVDGVEVTVDSDYVTGVPSDGGLYIGVSKDLDATSFFSGLIDDVRIYDVALTAEQITVLAQ